MLLVRGREIAGGLDFILPGEDTVRAVERADEEDDAFPVAVHSPSAEGPLVLRVRAAADERRVGSESERTPTQL